MPETPLLASEVTTEVESGYPAPVLANSNHLSINVELKVGVLPTGTLTLIKRLRKGGNHFSKRFMIC